MKKSGVLSCFLAVSQIAGAVVVEIRHNQIRAGPKFEYDPATTKFCSFWYDNVDGRTSCKDIPDSWDITEEQWKRWNPSISESCDNFVIEKSYCVEASNEPEVPRPVSSTTSSTMSSAVQSSTTTSSTTSSNSSTTVSTTTQKDNGIPTPTPTQPGMVDNCDKFHKVQSGDTCDKIANSQGITVSEFTTWNADIGGQACTGLWRDTYVCVSVIGHEPKPTPSKPDNGIAIATPSPFQPDIGGEACTGLWLDTYVCVSVIDYKPTPLTQPGIEKSCNKLHKAVAGDTCQKIVDRYGDLALAEFYKWNPAVGNGK
ncbi:hypothetical protein C2857_005987 [Epichloe festucae Fl1]|uniref:LysM domain-containing protein n=1 Tax=Epichloe festucae (strain Fl1) TaxID=877507 RepID=A0A7S9KT85_EPIFF|nr:hypothetical protein C2857_005987 [Epichloe festucae Fl1]